MNGSMQYSQYLSKAKLMTGHTRNEGLVNPRSMLTFEIQKPLSLNNEMFKTFHSSARLSTLQNEEIGTRLIRDQKENNSIAPLIIQEYRDDRLKRRNSKNNSSKNFHASTRQELYLSPQRFQPNLTAISPIKRSEIIQNLCKQSYLSRVDSQYKISSYIEPTKNKSGYQMKINESYNVIEVIQLQVMDLQHKLTDYLKTPQGIQMKQICIDIHCNLKILKQQENNTFEKESLDIAKKSLVQQGRKLEDMTKKKSQYKKSYRDARSRVSELKKDMRIIKDSGVEGFQFQRLDDQLKILKTENELLNQECQTLRKSIKIIEEERIRMKFDLKRQSPDTSQCFMTVQKSFSNNALSRMSQIASPIEKIFNTTNENCEAIKQRSILEEINDEDKSNLSELQNQFEQRLLQNSNEQNSSQLHDLISECNKQLEKQTKIDESEQTNFMNLFVTFVKSMNASQPSGEQDELMNYLTQAKRTSTTSLSKQESDFSDQKGQKIFDYRPQISQFTTKPSYPSYLQNKHKSISFHELIRSPTISQISRDRDLIKIEEGNSEAQTERKIDKSAIEKMKNEIMSQLSEQLEMKMIDIKQDKQIPIHLQSLSFGNNSKISKGKEVDQSKQSTDDGKNGSLVELTLSECDIQEQKPDNILKEMHDWSKEKKLLSPNCSSLRPPHPSKGRSLSHIRESSLSITAFEKTFNKFGFAKR